MVCRSVHISPSCFESCSWFVGVFIFHPLVLRAVHGFVGVYEHSYKPLTALRISGRNMNTPTKHEQLSKQEAEI
jgi:hypothetical protein